jgi:hypothetical protein
VVVRVDDRHRASLEFAPSDVFRWRVCTVDATDAESVEEVLARAGAAVASSLESNDGLPLAARVEIAGACAAHAAMSADPERWINYVRNTALQYAAGQVWVEKVKLRTTPPRDFESPTDGPLAEIRQYVEELKRDDVQLANLVQLLSDFRSKLPEELRDAEGLALAHPERLRTLLDEVEPLLLGRLTNAPSDEG